MKLKVLLTQDELQKRIKKLSQEILNFYKKEIYIIGVLKGCFVFLSDLIRYFPQNIKIIVDFIQVKSYKGSQKDKLTLLKDINIDIKNKNILIVDDIFDTGETTDFLIKHLKSKNPKSIKICTLLYKYQMRKVNFEPDFFGFKIPNYFVVGYGLDYNENYRHLPFIAYLD